MKIFLRRLLRMLYTMITLPGYIVWGLGLASRLQRRSWRRLEQMAADKGLSIKHPSSNEDSGVVYGDVQGTNIVIKPDNRGHSTVSALFGNQKDIVLGSSGKVGKDNPAFDLAAINSTADRIFRYQRIGEQEFSSLQRHPEVLEHLTQFYVSWMWHVKSMTVAEQQLICYLRQNWLIPAISADVAEKLVPELVELTREFERVFGSEGQAVSIEKHL